MAEPTLVSISAALAARAPDNLYVLVKREFSRSDEKAEVLRAAEGAGGHSLEVSRMASMLEAAEHDNPGSAKALRGTWLAERRGVVGGGECGLAVLVSSIARNRPQG
jgi:hypothetical protein